MILNWLRKRLGYHVCEEFTQWETQKKPVHRVVTARDGNLYTAGVQTVLERTERWQERTCTICGKLEQRSIR